MISVRFFTKKSFFCDQYEAQAKYKKLRFTFTASGNFPGKANSHIVGVGMYYKPTKFDQNH